MTTILAVDPGAKSGYCIIRDKEVLLAKGIAGDDVEAVYKLLIDLQQDYNIDKVVIESQFISNPKGYRTLCFRADIWCIVCQILHLPVSWCAPSQWQAGLGIKKLKIEKPKGTKLTAKQKKLRRDSIKEQALSIAKKVSEDKKLVSSDIADAICIAWWAIDHLDKLK